MSLSTVRTTREDRWALLAAARPDELIELADACLAAAADFHVIVPPQVGYVSAQVREPILKQRFLLGDVLACRAEVELNGARGWALRLGEDRAAVLAMAILDATLAVAESAADAATAGDGGPAGGGLADGIDRLCVDLAARRRLDEAAEWAELADTVVEFEEL
jgi:alpha-D-ribose 1-methylphosphonate 5-triphosphate synthase subunit PhnG